MSKRSKKSAPSETPTPAFDRRTMEKTMADVRRLLNEREFDSVEEMNTWLNDLLASGKLPAFSPCTSEQQAQELMYDAWETPGKRRRITLARKALEIFPDCADAYVLLAEEAARSLEEARDLYEQGVKAGERAIGPDGFEEYIGLFWGVLQTRPYMRARAGLAQTLWLLGEHEQAVEHLQDMLCLNPNDNQGLRYMLMEWLLNMGDDHALGKVLDRYEGDCTAKYLYTAALWLYRREGATPTSNRALKTALKANPFVPRYMSGRNKMPKQPPDCIGFGDENEAVAYVMEAHEVWANTEGALAWLVIQTARQGDDDKKAS